MASSGGTHRHPGYTDFLLLSGAGLGAVIIQAALDGIGAAELWAEVVLVSFQSCSKYSMLPTS